MHNTTIHLSSSSISDLFVNGSVSLPLGSLVISNTVNLLNALNTQQDNITLLGGTNVTITGSPIDTWAINSVGLGGANYTNTDKYLLIDNNSGTINLSNHISVTNISCGNLSSKYLSLVGDISSYRVLATHVSTTSISIPDCSLEIT